jgi:hypothetical protein
MVNQLLTVACVLIPSLFAWDAFRRHTMLSHGRLLASDRALVLERQIEEIRTRLKLDAEALDRHRASLTEQHDFARNTLKSLVDYQNNTDRAFAELHARFAERDSRLDAHDIRCETIERVNTAHAENLATFMNEARLEITKLQQNQTMALQGLGGMGRRPPPNNFNPGIGGSFP